MLQDCGLYARVQIVPCCEVFVDIQNIRIDRFETRVVTQYVANTVERLYTETP